MEKKNNRSWLVGLIVIVVIIVLICGPMLVDSISEWAETKKEYELLQEGKVEDSEDVIKQIVEILKNEQKNEIESYLSDDFKYYDYNNLESCFVDGMWRDLQPLTSNYDIERRGDTSSDDMATYRVYWNVEDLSLSRDDLNYCSQILTIILQRVISQDNLTYEISSIMLTNN